MMYNGIVAAVAYTSRLLARFEAHDSGERQRRSRILRRSLEGTNPSRSGTFLKGISVQADDHASKCNVQ